MGRRRKEPAPRGWVASIRWPPHSLSQRQGFPSVRGLARIRAVFSDLTVELALMTMTSYGIIEAGTREQRT